MEKTERAVVRFKDGCLCSQSVLATFAPQFGLPLDTAMRLAAPFGSGIARNGEMCGAVSGALMVIGLAHGPTAAEDQQAKEETYHLVNDFMAEFQVRNGSLKCIDLLGCQINTPENVEKARASGVFDNVCPKLVKDAVEILTCLLSDEL